MLHQDSVNQLQTRHLETTNPMEKLINQLKDLGDSAHLAGEFELSTVLLEAEKTIRALDREVEVAQHNAACAAREQCIEELLEAINTKRVDAVPVKKERTALLPEWLQEVFGGEA